MADTPAAHIFGQDQLDKAIALLSSPLDGGAADCINAVMGAIDKDGVEVVASFGRGTQSMSWKLQAVARHDWRGDNDAKVKVILKW